MLRTAPEERQQEKWTVETELLAMAVEEISLVATHEMGRRKPIKIPRPDHIKAGRRRVNRPDDAGGSNVVDLAGYKRAVGVLSGSRRKVVT